MQQYPYIDIAGENALIVYFAQTSNPQVSASVNWLAQQVTQSCGAELIDTVPSYASLLVIFDPLISDHFQFGGQLRHLLKNLPALDSNSGKLVELPAYYGVEAGLDLVQLAANAELGVDEVIRLHTESEYRVYAIGFAPGFAYLGDVDTKIAAPRLSTPRQKVPKGAVAIADRQTAVYPSESPGGWNIIGRCPTPMFDPDMTPNMPVAVGDKVKFVAVSKAEYLSLGGEL